MPVWFLIAFGIAGAGLAATGRPNHAWLAQCLWIVSNGGLLLHNLSIGQWAQAVLFGVFLVLAVIGSVTWRKKI